jgi:hypothetical protein
MAATSLSHALQGGEREWAAGQREEGVKPGRHTQGQQQGGVAAVGQRQAKGNTH